MEKNPKTEGFGVIPEQGWHRFRKEEFTLSYSSKFKLKERVLGDKGEKSFMGHFLMASPRLPVLKASTCVHVTS